MPDNKKVLWRAR